jgi:tetratricopeptide (TPR) repeat protein
MLKARDWVQENTSSVLVVVGAVVLLAVAIWFFTSRSEQQREAAYELLGRAEMELRTGQLQVAAIDFQKVLDDFGGSPAAKLACFKLANTYFQQGDYVKAEEYYRKYLKDYLIDEISRYSAMEGIAASLAGQGRFQEAAEQYLEVAGRNPNSVTYELNLFHAVENAVKAGDGQTAREAFALLEEKGITSEHYRTAKIIMIENDMLSYDDGEFK